MGKRQARRDRYKKFIKLPSMGDIWEGLSVVERRYLVLCVNTDHQFNGRSQNIHIGTLALVSLLTIQELLSHRRQVYRDNGDNIKVPNAYSVTRTIDRLVNKDIRRQMREHKKLMDELRKPNHIR